MLSLVSTPELTPRLRRSNKGIVTWRCWTLTTGEAGFRSQVRGLAERLGFPFAEKTLTLPIPWSWLPGHVAAWGLHTTGTHWKDFAGLHPPWPDLLITCSRRSAALSLLIKKVSAGKVFTVHIQDPQIPPRFFDMVIPLSHDGLTGGNVHSTRGALHALTPVQLASAAQRFYSTFQALPRPLVAVLIGGSSKAYQLSPERALDIGRQLYALARGCGLIVTLSRRTGEANAEILRHELTHPNIFLWDGTGENPYPAILTLADHILVTSDSVSMISEASATGKPISIIELPGRSKRLRAFHERMHRDGIVRSFDGVLEHWTYVPVDETGEVAEIVRRYLTASAKHPP